MNHFTEWARDRGPCVGIPSSDKTTYSVLAYDDEERFSGEFVMAEKASQSECNIYISIRVEFY